MTKPVSTRRDALKKGALVAGVGAAAVSAPRIQGLGLAPSFAMVASGCVCQNGVYNYSPTAQQNFEFIQGNATGVTTTGACLTQSRPGGGSITVCQTDYTNNTDTAVYSVTVTGDPDPSCTYTIQYWEDTNAFNNGDPFDVQASAINGVITLVGVQNGASRLRIETCCGPDCP